MGCLDKVIKLSRTECECFDDNKPADYNEGQSEVYLDEVPGLSLSQVLASEGCEAGGMWDMLSKARESATLQFKTDILTLINRDYKPRLENYSGLIGQAGFTSTLSFSQAYAGVKYSFANIVGGYMNVKRIALAVNQSAAVTVQVYDNDENQTTPLAQYTINTTANTLTYATIVGGLKLPLWSKNGIQLKYYFVYSTAGGILPKDNKADCGCGGKSNQVTWKNWLVANGIRANTIDIENENFSHVDKYLNGLLLDVALSCESARLLCSDEYPLDFDNDANAMQIAYAIRFKAAEILVSNILSSDEINRYTMLDRESLYGKRNSYAKQYNDLLEYLVGAIQVTNTDCLICRNSNQFAKGKLLS